MSAQTDWINAQLKRLEDAEDEIVAYQIAKDNLELRLIDVEYDRCAISWAEYQQRIPRQVY